ncbi:MAG: T9SS type A sorting domain-containing protein [Sphingobacteriaceae bacterium]|nr:MAG: T9SS type A sorting domain-containing protein [Sphingobacteriaceae bacterium]
MINNLGAIEDKNGNFTYAIQGTPGNSQSLFAPIGGRVLWNNGAVVDGNQVKVVLDQVNGLETEGTYIGTLSLPDLQVVGTPDKSYDKINCIMQDGEYNYIYYGESPGTFERYTKLARVKKGSLHSQIPWEYYSNDGTWSASKDNAKRLISGAVASHVMKLGEGSYVMNAVPNLSDEIVVWFATNPAGPWINRTVVYKTPAREAVLSYFGHIDAGSGKDGVYTFTYSSYPFIDDPFAMQLNDKGVYTIHYAKANLLELSPFQPKKQLDSLTSYSVVPLGRDVVLKWTTAQTGHDHFEVEESRDQYSWTTVATVAGGSGNSYRTTMKNPAPGMVYYRLKLYNADKEVTTLQTVKYNVAPNASFLAYDAVAVGNRVKITFRTSIELLNPGFVLGRSAVMSSDLSNWVKLADIEGAGTKNTYTDYEFYDENPLNGINYYAMVYWKDGKEAYTSLRTVDMTSIPGITKTNTATVTTFDVYPNPSKGKVQFALKGYTGGDITVTLSDLFGKTIGKETFKVNSTETYILQARPSAGTYVVNVTGTGLSKSAKVILQ